MARSPGLKASVVGNPTRRVLSSAFSLRCLSRLLILREKLKGASLTVLRLRRYQDLAGLLIAGDSQSWALLLPGRVLQGFPRLFRFDRFCQAVR